MGRADVDRYLDQLDESFGAAAASADQIAADDLALSFLQDLELSEALARLGAFVAAAPNASFRPVTELGADYVVVALGRPTVIPSSRAVYRKDPTNAAPSLVHRTLVELLRHLARRCVQMRVDHPGGPTGGIITRAGRDHLGVRARNEEVIIPLAAVTGITLEREESWCF